MKLLKPLLHALEALVILLCYVLFRLLPMDAASWLGGSLARSFGPWLGVHRVALANLALAFPERSARERETLAARMWENLGRVVGEYPHLPRRAMAHRIRFIAGAEHVAAIAASQRSSLMVSGHIANWEIAPRAIHALGLSLALFYRPANNPFAEWLIDQTRKTYCQGHFRKGLAAARHMLASGKTVQHMGILFDQKTREGIAVPFFGHSAMTTTAPADLALKFGLPLVPVQVVRTKGCHFDVTIHPPRTYASGSDDAADRVRIMTELNALLESWIRAEPSQWFWVHRRWPKPGQTP